MITPFTFKGKIGRAPYAAWSVALFLSQYLVILAGPGNSAFLKTGRWILAVPHRSLLTFGGDADFLLRLVYLLLLAWALAALAFRRAVDANVDGGIAAVAIAPIIQIPAILYLCFAPSKVTPESRANADYAVIPEPVSVWPPAFLGVFAGVSLTLIAVAVGALVFRTYGYGLFLLTPFVIGAITGYVANSRADIGIRKTALAVAA